MSENGKVVVRVEAPVLGKMIGAQTLKDIRSGKAEASKKDEPAVVTKPLGEKQP